MYIASLVLGIISLLLCWFPIIGFIISIIALVISIIAMVKKKPEGKGMGIAGIILSILAVVFSLIITLISMSAAYLLNEGADELKEKSQSALYASDIANAKSKLAMKSAEITSLNWNNEYTGYIDEYTEEYVSAFEGIELEEFYEEYIEDMYPKFDADIDVDSEGRIVKIEIE